MTRRRSARRLRRLQVNFWKRGETHAYPGYTTNISLTGMFIGSNSPLPSGCRVRVEILDREHGFMVEGVVAHARKIPGELGRVAQSGMGVRFLTIDELIHELLPHAALESTEAVPYAEATHPSPSPTAAPPLAPAAPPAAPALEPESASVPPAPTALPPASPPPLGGGVFSVRFSSPRHFLDVYQRDIKNGGLFVSTRHPGRLQEVVSIDIHPPELGAEPIRLRARVVQRFDPRPDAAGAGSNLLAGMGVEILEPQIVNDRLLPIITRLSGG
ncbi:MAG TPA: PilZ domain-containing protein [Thermoanaerobaculia bacterium]|nr:PilZ domain-containing protein [Thermoanaerobaculia bacterium]